MTAVWDRLFVLACFAVLGSAPGCKGDAQDAPGAAEGSAADEGPLAVDQPTVEPDLAIPQTVEEFLERLVPLPSPAIVVVYEVTGPGNMQGTLELSTKPGGWRKEAWTLRIPVPGAEGPGGSAVVTEVRGTVIQTPREIWTGIADQAGEVMPNPLASLGEAYLELSPTKRNDVLSALEGWYGKLAEARTEAPGERSTIAGEDCLQTRVAAQNVCIWEAAGLPLAYEGAQFSLRAKEIRRPSSLPETTFERPAVAADAVEKPSPIELDPQAALGELANGDYAPLALVLTPGFRVPNARTDP